MSFTYLGESSTSTIGLFNNTTLPAQIQSVWFQGEQSQAGFLTTFAGNPGIYGIDPTTTGGTPVAASEIKLLYPEAMMNGGNETVFIADREHHLVLLYNPATQNMTMFAGTGTPCANPTDVCGDGGLAVNAMLNKPRAFARDGIVNLYVADTGNYRIRMITSPYLTNTPMISTVAGSGVPCTDPTDPCGDEGLAVNARFGQILGIARAPNTNDVFISDYDNCRIRRLDVNGYIHAVAGNGQCGFGGDGDLAGKASLNHPSGIFFDELGNLYIADTGNNRVRLIDPITGMISTYAGNGSAYYDGDFLPATSVGVPAPRSMTVDFMRNLYIVGGDSTLRKVDVQTGLISTVAGTGVPNFNGDGLGALTQLSSPQGATTDGAGNLLIADSNNGYLRRVDFYTQNTAQEYTQTNDCPAVVDPGTGCTLTLTFAPALHNLRRVTLFITEGGNNLMIPISGLGVHTYALVSVPNQQKLQMAEAAVGGTGTTNTFRLGGSGSWAFNLTEMKLIDPSGSFTYNTNCAPGPIPSYGYCRVDVTFTPPASGQADAQFQILSDAKNGTQTVNVTGMGVVPQAPVVTWNPPANITYGTALDKSILAATANVPGSFTYNYALGTVLPAGQAQALIASFAPADPVAYTKLDTTAAININPAPITVTPDNVFLLATQTLPTLTGKITGIMNNDPITATYATNAVRGQVGTYQITPTIVATPQVLSNYAAPTLNTGVLTIGSTSGVDLQQKAIAITGAPYTAGGTISVIESVVNNGQTPAGSTTTLFYLSTTGTNNWMMLGNRVIASLTTGAASSATTTLSLPSSVTGAYYIRVCANAYRTVAESDYTNNCGTSAQFTINIGVNLVETSVGYTPVTPVAGGTIQVTDTTTNLGPTTSGSSSTTYYLATIVNGVVSNAKWMYMGNRSVGPVANGAPSTGSITFTLPLNLKGTYGVTACANAYKTALESNYNDNCTTTTATFKLP